MPKKLIPCSRETSTPSARQSRKCCIEERFRKIVEEFIAWMIEKGHLDLGAMPNLRTIDPRTSSFATQAGRILHKAVLHSERSGRLSRTCAMVSHCIWCRAAERESYGSFTMRAKNMMILVP